MESIARRTHTAGELRAADAGKTVILQGWAANIRDRGGVMFIVLRDRHGTVQLTLDDASPEAAWEGAKRARLEYCLEIEGTVQLRDAAAVNADMATGEVEVRPTRVRVLSPTLPLPFPIAEHSEASEEVRLKYRYLDLRRPNLQHNMMVRHKLYMATRNYMDNLGFVEVETPILNKSTPEGARDYLVPSRVHAGQWYALPQSPQIFKQILMISGMDRYFQIVKCFRDEDLRADRQPEFTQIDVEVSFATQGLIMEIIEGLARTAWKQILGVDLDSFPVLTYDRAMSLYGVDAPDTRFGMEHVVLDWGSTGFGVVKGALDAGGIAKAMVVKGAAEGTSRKVLDQWTDFVKRYRLSGLLWGKVNADGWSGPLSKVEEELRAQIPGVEVGDVVLVAAGKDAHVHAGLGRLRAHVARERGLIQEGRFSFCWVVDFPGFEQDEDSGEWHACHHPFTKPKDEHIPDLMAGELHKVKSDAYDLVCNGYEIAGGSIRIHDSEVQAKVFEVMGFTEETAKRQFGFLIDALKYGAPPHGGIACGFDRWCMLLAGTDNIRDVIAFPKTTSAQDLMASSPSYVDPKQLAELFVANTVPQED